MLKKTLALFLIISICPVIAGLYGIVHDQLTYTISPEYYTKFKFFQFGIWIDGGDEAIFSNPRTQVAKVGLLATWWTGAPIGIVLGFIGLIHNPAKIMLQVTMKAIAVVLIITLLTGLIGLAYGKAHLAESGVSWWLPENLVDTKNFIAVGSMHNFSYLGGLFGLVGGATYSVLARRKYKYVTEL